MVFLCNDFYVPGDDGGIRFDDEKIGINWPVSDGMALNILDRDKNWALL